MRRPLLALAATVAILVCACGPAPGPDGGTVTVFAAASLTESFNTIAAEIQNAHPGLVVRSSFASSSTLAAQIQNGADADVFASADEANMAKLVGAGLTAGAPVVFAGNRLEIVVQAGNPKHVTALADLARPDVSVVLGAPPVPVGVYAQQALAKADVTVRPKSLETDVKQVVAKVALGEADAGIVYRTDIRAGGSEVEGIAIPGAQNVPASYPIAVVKGARNAGGAAAFVEFVRSARGRAILERYGFTLP